MKQTLPAAATVVTLAIMVFTAIFHTASLVQTLRTLSNYGDRNPSNLKGSPLFHSYKLCLCLTPLLSYLSDTAGSQRELSWKSSAQIALNFTNDFFHITSDKGWTFQPTVFKPDPQSDREYILSMHQQLHCLNIIRAAYLTYHTSRPRLSTEFYAEAEMCIEQIRQHLMCTTDVTLEPTELVMSASGEDMVPGSRGAGVVHRCRDWKGLESALDSMVV